MSNSGFTAVSTQKLDNEAGYETATQIYDAMLRTRATPHPRPWPPRSTAAPLGGLVGYAESTSYDAWSRPLQERVGNSSGLADITNVYNPHDGTLNTQAISREKTVSRDKAASLVSYPE